jgi:hypothetical protein
VAVLARPPQQRIPTVKTRHKECFQVFETDIFFTDGREIPQRTKFFSKHENTFVRLAAALHQWLPRDSPVGWHPRAGHGQCCCHCVELAPAEYCMTAAPPRVSSVSVQRLYHGAVALPSVVQPGGAFSRF